MALTWRDVLQRSVQEPGSSYEWVRWFVTMVKLVPTKWLGAHSFTGLAARSLTRRRRPPTRVAFLLQMFQQLTFNLAASHWLVHASARLIGHHWKHSYMRFTNIIKCNVMLSCSENSQVYNYDYGDNDNLRAFPKHPNQTVIHSFTFHY